MSTTPEPRGRLWPIASAALVRGVPRDIARRSLYGADGAFPASPEYACALTRPRPSAFAALRGWIGARLIRPRVWWASRGDLPF